MTDHVDCTYCHGTGMGQYGPPESSCMYCHGRGYHIPQPEDDSAHDAASDKRMEESQ